MMPCPQQHPIGFIVLCECIRNGRMGLAHHREPFIRDAPCHIVLIDADKQAVKFRQPFFGLCQTLSVPTDSFLAGQAELLLHDLPEVLLVSCHIKDDRFHVHPDQIFQNNRPDKVR